MFLSRVWKRGRKKLPCRWGWWVLLLLSFSLPAQATKGPLLLVTGELRGELEPCGCSPEGQMGGLPRRLAYIDQARQGEKDRLLLLDVGNNFPSPSPQGRLKVKLIENMLAHFPPAAILPGPNELALGVKALSRQWFYLLSNDGRGAYFKPQRTVMRGGLRIGIYGFLSPQAVYQKSQSHFKLLPVNAALLDRLRAAIVAHAHQRSVLLFRGNDAELALFVEAGIFDAIIAGNPHDDELNQVVQRQVGAFRVPQIPTKGQGVLRLSLARKRPADAAPLGAEVDWLTERYADHPAAQKPFAAYDAAVKKLFFAKMETMRQRRQETPYAGAKICRTCHAAAHAVWETSRHARALATLERVGKQFDPECLTCHVVGLERGGYLSKELTPQLANVQCENCHGSARSHAANPLEVKPKTHPTGVGEATCRTCHVGSHSPLFDFRTYWPKVRHGHVSPETKR